MKISDMITEEMVEKIINFGAPMEDIDDRRIKFELNYEHPGYDLARFLFVDAWDYFEKKGWFITVTHELIQTSKEKFSIDEEAFWIGNSPNFGEHPSRLHAMAAAVAYMWEQEAKQ